MILRASGHLFGVFEPCQREMRLKKTAEKLRRVEFDTIVVTGISGTVLGSILASRLGKNLAVVRRPNEAQQTLSGCANDVEGYLGGRWIFFDDMVATGTTRRRTKAAYVRALTAAGQEATYVGFYLHAHDYWGTADDEQEGADEIPF